MIELQKIHTMLGEKFDKLSKELSSLLNLFEMTARSFADHPSVLSSDKDKAFLEKVDKLLEQNKTIAKGLMIMEERTRERLYGQPHEETHEEEHTTPLPNRPLPKF